MTYVKNKSSMVLNPHFAIVEFSSILIPGDERSRTHPGHGYPEHTESVVNYIAFTDEAEWRDAIHKRMNSPYGNKDNFVAIRAVPASIAVQTIVNVS